jgi:hypothetical protein
VDQRAVVGLEGEAQVELQDPVGAEQRPVAAAGEQLVEASIRPTRPTRARGVAAGRLQMARSLLARGAMRVLFVLFSPLVLSAVACGGNVVVDDVGPGGAGGASIGGTGAGGTSGGGAGDAGPAPQVCTDLCQAEVADGCEDFEPCVVDCAAQRLNAASCASAFDALVTCSIAQAQASTDCHPVHACDAPRDAYEVCVLAGSCAGEEVCTVFGCTATCGGVTFETQCHEQPWTCSCLRNGAILGSCSSDDLADAYFLTSSIYFGCCASFFEASP